MDKISKDLKAIQVVQNNIKPDLEAIIKEIKINQQNTMPELKKIGKDMVKQDMFNPEMQKTIEELKAINLEQNISIPMLKAIKLYLLDIMKRVYKPVMQEDVGLDLTFGTPNWLPGIDSFEANTRFMKYFYGKYIEQIFVYAELDPWYSYDDFLKSHTGVKQVELDGIDYDINWNINIENEEVLVRVTFLKKDDLKWRAVGRMEAGQSQVEVAKWLNVNKSVVIKIWKQFIETGTIKRKEGSGSKRKTATTEDCYLVVTAKRYREMTAIQLSNELSSATGTRISRQTVYRRLHEGALYARRPMVCISLTSAHRRARLNWCLEHHAWIHDQWANVLFSDESRFTFIWREPGTRYHPSNIREIDSFRGGSLLVWAGISSSRRTPLHIFSGGTLTAQRYRDKILEPYLRPYRDQIGHNLILMDDNARPHRARLVNEYLQSENIRRMDWPARSPDLNPIEHVWDVLGRRIGARHPSLSIAPPLGTHQNRVSAFILRALLKEMGRHDITFTADNAKDHYGGRKFRFIPSQAYRHVQTEKNMKMEQNRKAAILKFLRAEKSSNKIFDSNFHNTNDVMRTPITELVTNVDMKEVKHACGRLQLEQVV
ncbi:hypothetical protein LAZ67_1002641 [Cordylochernes scorpioides]|uniref:Transposase n=1 Tax=Cordylochernes scorpioides TaxID=51811 RepID=A0ABY6JW78_9ARAC|nr:hypothetical protein LAZ67_1002641 [Cordylochernes scorpioides]